ncbi:RING/FYVE/PHD zinc finger superfamily protein [Zea mays]|uniref:RING/FYVE/PHD zinc finger superfamily protein n=1 Tax=Zea mays TaxID=4577 RepID=A0A1D6GZN2_MAIZE|nr:RING/FYVE/PHD zinc finger superfamily protein [Zea mays]
MWSSFLASADEESSTVTSMGTWMDGEVRANSKEMFRIITVVVDDFPKSIVDMYISCRKYMKSCVDTSESTVRDEINIVDEWGTAYRKQISVPWDLGCAAEIRSTPASMLALLIENTAGTWRWWPSTTIPWNHVIANAIEVLDFQCLINILNDAMTVKVKLILDGLLRRIFQAELTSSACQACESPSRGSASA